MDSKYGFQQYLIRRKVLTFLGAKFHIYGPDGSLVFFSKQKAFKIREDIRVYTDESMQTEALSIKARQIMDFSAAYDVIDTADGTKVGAVKRKGFNAMIQDKWIIMDADDNEIGSVNEDNLTMALLRRFATNLIPQNFTGEVGGAPVFTFKQMFNPFIQKIGLDFSPDQRGLLDRRLGIAIAILLCAVEGRQS
ncbi:MAG: hypothetical protein Q7S53_00425 [bacterium]|nr:hypothetical protein [bacterium]